MTTKKSRQNPLENTRVSLKLKLAALWTALMFLYIYVDYFHLFMPGVLQQLSAGKAFVFDITQEFLLTTLAFLTIPVLMIFLSVALPAQTNRWTNIITAAVYIPFTLFNLTGHTWMHMVWGAVTEVALLCLVIGYAWKWPRVEA